MAETIIAYAENKKKIHYFRGITLGVIIKPSGNKDFGWGPIFRPKGANKSFGQMSEIEKQKWSMRIKAFVKLKWFLIQK